MSRLGLLGVGIAAAKVAAAAAPSLTADPTSLDVSGGEQFFLLDCEEDLLATVDPPAGFQVDVDGGGYAADGAAESEQIGTGLGLLVMVRRAFPAPPEPASGDIVCTAPGATGVNVHVTYTP